MHARVKTWDISGAKARWLNGILAFFILLSLAATSLDFAGIGRGSARLQGMSFVRWQAFGNREYEPMAAKVTVMTGRETEAGGEFTARRMAAGDWRRLPHPSRIVTWQRLVEAPLMGPGSVEWLWNEAGRPTAPLFELGAMSGAVMVEDPVSGRTWLFEREWERP